MDEGLDLDGGYVLVSLGSFEYRYYPAEERATVEGRNYRVKAFSDEKEAQFWYGHQYGFKNFEEETVKKLREGESKELGDFKPDFSRSFCFLGMGYLDMVNCRVLFDWYPKDLLNWLKEKYAVWEGKYPKKKSRPSGGKGSRKKLRNKTEPEPKPAAYEEYWWPLISEEFNLIFEPIFKCLRYLHTDQRYHGNLYKGIVVGDDNRGRLFSTRQMPKELYDQQKDERDELALIIKAIALYPTILREAQAAQQAGQQIKLDSFEGLSAFINQINQQTQKSLDAKIPSDVSELCLKQLTTAYYFLTTDTEVDMMRKREMYMYWSFSPPLFWKNEKRIQLILCFCKLLYKSENSAVLRQELYRSFHKDGIYDSRIESRLLRDRIDVLVKKKEDAEDERRKINEHLKRQYGSRANLVPKRTELPHDERPERLRVFRNTLEHGEIKPDPRSFLRIYEEIHRDMNILAEVVDAVYHLIRTRGPDQYGIGLFEEMGWPLGAWRVAAARKGMWGEMA